MKYLGWLGFYSCYIKNLHIDIQPIYDLIKDSTTFHWTKNHEKLSNSFKERIHKDSILAVPSTDYPVHFHVDSSNVGTGCVLIQQFPEGKRIFSFNSCFFDKAEQKNVHPPSKYMRNRISSSDIRILHHPITVSRLYLLWAQTNSLFMGRQRTTLTSFLPISDEHYEVPELEDHLDARLQLSFSNYSQQKHHDRRIPKAPIATQTYCAWYRVFRREAHSGFIPVSARRQPSWYLRRLLPYKVQTRKLRKNTEITKPSVVYLTIFQLLQPNRLLTVSGWDDLLTNLDGSVGETHNQTHPSIHPILSIVQSTLLVRPKTTKPTRIATTIFHTTLIRTLKMTILYAISVYKLINPDSARPNKLTN